MGRIDTYARRALDVLLPAQCLACDATVAEPGRLCGSCFADSGFITEPLCVSCGLPFEFEAEAGRICGLCAASPPAFDHARAAIRYDGPLRSSILKFKHGDRTDMAAGFAALLQRAGRELLPEADLIAPVPLHRRRLWRRRYNQSAMMALALSERCGVPALADLLVRKRPTPSQGGLSATARRRNIRGAFAVNDEHRSALRDRNVVLVDDVYTTGATAEACARVLRLGGAAGVSVLVVARVVQSGRVH